MKKFNIHDWQHKQKQLSEQNRAQKEDQLKMAYAAYDKAEMDGDIRGQELALAVIDLIKDKRIKGLGPGSDEFRKKVKDYLAKKDKDPEDLRLEPEDSEYEDGTEFYDEEDYDFDPEDDYVDEVELKDLDFKTLKAAFPKFYQKSKSTRMQPNGEEGPYYKDAISFPNADDSSTVIADESALEDWKAKTLKRFGNVEIEFNDEAENWFDRVKIYDDAFADAEAEFTKGKQDFINKERELGRSID
tara:strand:- start:49 stop:780 length:732 start_codon:yes stop_codon:yes gene_type:complete